MVNIHPFEKQSIAIPSSFCEYSGGECDQPFTSPLTSDGLSIYPSDPEIIASTIKECIPKVRPVTYENIGVFERLWLFRSDYVLQNLSA